MVRHSLRRRARPRLHRDHPRIPRRRGLDARLVDNGIIIVAFAALVGGRLYHVIDQWQLYKDDLSKIVLPPYAGLGVYGGIVTGTIAAWYITRRWHQLNRFAGEVTRVAREVGTEGKLGGQANVPGVAGTWKDLTDSVNSMAGNLTAQVRNIAEVTTAVARGDLSRKITVDVKGEILELKNTINTMVDQLNAFAAK